MGTITGRTIYDLATRTRARQSGIWLGTMWPTPLGYMETQLNLLHGAMVESLLTIADEVFLLKENELNRTVTQDLTEVSQLRSLADDKAATQRQEIALRQAAEDALYAAKVVDALIQAAIMTAREYAGAVECQLIRDKAAQKQLAVEAEGVRADTLNAEVELEIVKQAYTDIDIAKNKLAAAHIAVRVILAGISADQAGLDVISAQVEAAMQVAAKAGLQADIALIYAEAITKQLSTIKLQVEREKLVNNFTFLKDKLTNALSLWGQRGRTEDWGTRSAQEIAAEMLKLLAAEKDGEDLQTVTGASAVNIQAYTRQRTLINLKDKQAIKDLVVRAHNLLANTKNIGRIDLIEARAIAHSALNVARQKVFDGKTTTQITSAVRAKSIRKA